MSTSERAIDPKELMSLMDKGEAVSLIDVRRKDDCGADASTIPGAVWKDPNLVAEWGDQLPKDREVILYCVRGGSVSNTVLDQLLARGIKARYIQGGISAWKEKGGPLSLRGAGEK